MFSWRAWPGTWEEVEGPFGEARETPRAGGAQAGSHRIDKQEGGKGIQEVGPAWARVGAWERLVISTWLG